MGASAGPFPDLGSFLERTQARLLQTKHDHAVGQPRQLEVSSVFTAQNRTKHCLRVRLTGSPCWRGRTGSVAAAHSPRPPLSSTRPLNWLFTRILNNETHSSEGTAHSEVCKHDFARWTQSRRCWKQLSGRPKGPPLCAGRTGLQPLAVCTPEDGPWRCI